MIISGEVNIHPQEIENVMMMHRRSQTSLSSAFPTTTSAKRSRPLYSLCRHRKPGDAIVDELKEYRRHRLASFEIPARSISSMSSPATLPASSSRDGSASPLGRSQRSDSLIHDRPVYQHSAKDSQCISADISQPTTK